MDGYLDGPPLNPDAGFNTADVGHFDERGVLHVEGRGDDTIITGGENVYPLEVESVLQGAPGIAACVVFGTPDK